MYAAYESLPLSSLTHSCVSSCHG